MSARKCPRPKKRRYKTSADAQRAMQGALCSPTNLYVPVAVYRCRCGFWHLAHSTSYGRNRRRNGRR